VVVTRRPNAPFHWAVEFMATSRNLGGGAVDVESMSEWALEGALARWDRPPAPLDGKLVMDESWVPSNSPEPRGVILRRRVSSTCLSGRRRMRSLSRSGVIVRCFRLRMVVVRSLVVGFEGERASMLDNDAFREDPAVGEPGDD